MIDNQLIRKSLSKPKYKEKIRIRSYKKCALPEDVVYLEIKKKYNKLGNKRRTKIRLEDALQFIETGKKPELKVYMNKQVINELEYLLTKNKLYPKTYISYERMAYFNLESHDLRITFDTNIRSSREGEKSRTLLDSNYWIMEIKTRDSLPLWMTNLLTSHKIYKVSFSKYGKEYEMMLQDKISESISNKEIFINETIQQEERIYAGINFKHEYY